VVNIVSACGPDIRDGERSGKQGKTKRRSPRKADSEGDLVMQVSRHN
jgi:hypothetical protein